MLATHEKREAFTQLLTYEMEGKINMPKFIIRWNAGYGEDYQLIDAQDHDDAEQQAYEAWKEEVENNADCEALEFTLENAEEYGFEQEHPDYEEDED